MKRKVLTLTLGALLIVGVMAPAAFASWGIPMMQSSNHQNTAVASEDMYVGRGDSGAYDNHMFNWGEYRAGETEIETDVDFDQNQTWSDHFNYMQQYNYQMDSNYMMGDSQYSDGGQRGNGHGYGMMGR